MVETEITSKQRGNLYDISVSATLKALEVPEEFSCELRIPQANYTVRKETVIYPGEPYSRQFVTKKNSERFTWLKTVAAFSFHANRQGWIISELFGQILFQRKFESEVLEFENFGVEFFQPHSSYDWNWKNKGDILK